MSKDLPKSMEKYFFTWENYNVLDTLSLQFEDCTLVQTIGPYNKGDKIPVIVWDLEQGIIEFYTLEGYRFGKGKLNLSISDFKSRPIKKEN